jgi:hypothetical protein
MGFHNGIKFSPAGETPQKPNRGTRRLSENTLLLRPAANPEGLRRQAQNVLNPAMAGLRLRAFWPRLLALEIFVQSRDEACSRAVSWLETLPKLQYKQTDNTL